MPFSTPYATTLYVGSQGRLAFSNQMLTLWGGGVKAVALERGLL